MTRKQPSNGRDRRPKTISISLGDRGQTTQDFAVGIGVFILAVAFVFSFMPSILTPFDSTVSSGQTAQADRIADRIVSTVSDDNSTAPNALNWSEFESYDGKAEHELAEELGLRANTSRGVSFDRMNVTVQTLDDPSVHDISDTAIGREYDGQSAASSARIVTFDDAPFDCDPACRLVVRVW